MPEPLPENRKGRVPVEQLSELAEWQMLNEQQRGFVTAYIGNGYKAEDAVFTAYPNVTKPASAHVMAVRIMHSPTVALVLYLHFGDDPKEAFCRMLARLVAKGKLTREQLDGFKLLADIRGYRQPWAPHYEKQIAEGMSNGKEAIKRRVQREAKRKAVRTEADKQPKVNLLAEYERP